MANIYHEMVSDNYCPYSIRVTCVLHVIESLFVFDRMGPSKNITQNITQVFRNLHKRDEANLQIPKTQVILILNFAS